VPTVQTRTAFNRMLKANLTSNRDRLASTVPAETRATISENGPYGESTANKSGSRLQDSNRHFIP
jgi:hypothetical protein